MNTATKEVKEIVQTLQRVYEEDPFAEAFDTDLKSFRIGKVPFEGVQFGQLLWETNGRLEYYHDKEEGVIYYRKAS
jgi:hypothetical protein